VTLIGNQENGSFQVVSVTTDMAVTMVHLGEGRHATVVGVTSRERHMYAYSAGFTGADHSLDATLPSVYTSRPCITEGSLMGFNVHLLSAGLFLTCGSVDILL